MSFIDLVLISTGGALSCLSLTFLAGEAILLINERKLQQLKQQPYRAQQSINAETDRLVDLISQIDTDEDLETIINQCIKLKNPDITTSETRAITTLILTRLFTKACDDELRHEIISTIIDLEMADENKQVFVKHIETAQTKEKNWFLQIIEHVNQRLGGIN